MQYFNQILTAVLEVLDDSDSSIRELVLSLIVEMLNNQVRGWVVLTFCKSLFFIKYVDMLSSPCELPEGCDGGLY